jgi:catechol 2,3-dioxygenase-like lactoylglutathione lyase family enzyme
MQQSGARRRMSFRPQGFVGIFWLLPLFSASGPSERTPAQEALLAEADRALKAGPFSVMDKQLVPPSGDKHDYMSTGPYWWPDPTKQNGLPYVRRDGERNPEHDTSQTDSHSLQVLFASVETLALAYRETGEERYAARAAELVRVWFLKTATRMNPNLNYGQAIAGRTEGRGTGIIETRGLAALTLALAWLSQSKAWTDSDQQAMKAWFRQYLEWLLTSDNGRKEASAGNNHGTWYDVQVASLALFTGDQDLARRTVDEAKRKRIAGQIERDGRQPLELARTLSFSYSLFNLQALFDLASLGDRVGVDLWHFQTSGGRSLRAALDLLAPYVDAGKAWPHQQIHAIGLEERLGLASLLRRAALIYHEPDYEALLERLPAKEVRAARMQILWPGEVKRPRVLGVAHLALYVSDLAKSRSFYRDFLGFEEPFSLKRDDGSDRIAFIKINDRQYLELFAEPPKNDGRLNHIAIYTADARGMRDYLAAHGIDVPERVGKGRTGNYNFSIKDPDGHTVEIVEYLADSWTAREKGKYMPASRISTRLMHVGFLVASVEPAMKFYRDILGFDELWRGSASGKELSWINMRVPDGEDYVEFMLYSQVPDEQQRGSKNHVCLVLPDVEKAIAALRPRAARIGYDRPIEMRVGTNRKRQANLFDPDGTRIELMEPNTVDGKPTLSSTARAPR